MNELPLSKASPPAKASPKDLADHFGNSKQIMQKVNTEQNATDRKGNNLKPENEFIQDIDAHERKLNSKWMEKEWKRALDTGKMIEKYCEGIDNRSETIRSEVKALKDAMPQEDREAETGNTRDLRSMLNVVLAEGDMTEDDLVKLMNDKIQYYVDFSKGDYKDAKKVLNSSGEITDNSSGKYLFFFNHNQSSISFGVNSNGVQAKFRQGGSIKDSIKTKSTNSNKHKDNKNSGRTAISDLLGGQNFITARKTPPPEPNVVAALKCLAMTTKESKKHAELTRIHEERRTDYERKKLDRQWAKLSDDAKNDIRKKIILDKKNKGFHGRIQKLKDTVKDRISAGEIDPNADFEKELMAKMDQREKDDLLKILKGKQNTGLIDAWGYKNANVKPDQ
jgi:hypothetical protein